MQTWGWHIGEKGVTQHQCQVAWGSKSRPEKNSHHHKSRHFSHKGRRTTRVSSMKSWSGHTPWLKKLMALHDHVAAEMTELLLEQRVWFLYMFRFMICMKQNSLHVLIYVLICHMRERHVTQSTMRNKALVGYGFVFAFNGLWTVL